MAPQGHGFWILPSLWGHFAPIMLGLPETHTQIAGKKYLEMGKKIIFFIIFINHLNVQVWRTFPWVIIKNGHHPVDLPTICHTRSITGC